MRTGSASYRATIVCLIVVLLATCSGGGTARTALPDDQPPPGELKLILGPHPDETIVVHTDGSFELVSPPHTSMRGCGGACPRRVERFTVTGDKIMQGSRELLSRAANGSVDMWGLGQVTIDQDGALIESGQRRVLDAGGRFEHVNDGLDARIVGANTPELRRRAMLVLVFVGLTSVAAAINEVSH